VYNGVAQSLEKGGDLQGSWCSEPGHLSRVSPWGGLTGDKNGRRRLELNQGEYLASQGKVFAHGREPGWKALIRQGGAHARWGIKRRTEGKGIQKKKENIPW